MKKRNKLFVRLTAAFLIICTLCSIASAADLTSAVKDSLPVEISVENSVASFTLKNSGSEYYKYSVEVMDSDKETYLLCNNFEPNETAMVSGISAGLNYPLRLELYNPENVYFYEGSFSADAYGSVSASLSKVKTKANTENMSDEDIESLFEMTDKQYEKMFLSMDIPSFISEDEAKAAKHVKRLEEYENCYDRIGYKNADGSNTLYLFSSPVKYIDGSGKLCDAEPNICETDDSVKAEGYSHVNDYGELKTYFADSLSGSKGIKIQKKDSVLEFGFILPAQKETLLSKAASAVSDIFSTPRNKASLFTENREKKLEYAKVGKNADIISSPTTTGAVQTLILSDVPETNKITFRVSSNGTAPAVSEDRTSVSFIGENGCGFKVGITEMRDSHEGTDPNNSVHFSMANYLRVTESTNGETLIEVTLDEDMLTCPATVYPVSIVLSADAVTADGSSAVPTAGTAPAGLRAAAQYTNDTISYNRFEDQTVYTNGAVGQAAAQYLIVGNNTFYRDPYYDEMHCSYNPGGYVRSEGVAFLKYNLSGLNIDPRLINYASLILTEASGNSSSVTTDVRRVTKLWAENDINFTHIYSYDSSSNGNLELTFSDSGTAHKYEALITYNLTSQLMYQHDNHEGVANYGFMIKSRVPSIYKHICSSEYAQTAHRPKVVVSYCDPLDLSETYSSQDYFSSIHNLRWYKFTPDKTDTYDIFTEGSADTYGVLYSSALSPLASDNDSAQGYNFKMTYQLNAGVTYYIKVHRFSPQNYANGDYTIRVVETHGIKYVESLKRKDGGLIAHVTTFNDGNICFQIYAPGSEKWSDTFDLSAANIAELDYLYNKNKPNITSNIVLSKVKLNKAIEDGVWSVDINSDMYYGLWLYHYLIEELYDEKCQFVTNISSVIFVTSSNLYQWMMTAMSFNIGHTQKNIIDTYTYNSFARAIETFAVLDDATAVAEGITDAIQSIAGRPNWRQTEMYCAKFFKSSDGYKYNQSYKMINGVLTEVPYGTAGSQRPDFIKYDESSHKYKIGEVKNYTVTTESGRKNLANNIYEQYNKRIDMFGDNIKIEFVVDVRGQKYTEDILNDIESRVSTLTGKNNLITILNESN